MYNTIREFALWQLLPLLAPYKRQIGIGLAANGGARFFDLVPTLIVGRVVDAIQGGSLPPQRFFVYALWVLGTFIGLAIFQSVSSYNLGTMAQKVRHDLRTRLYRHIQRLDMSFFGTRQTGDILAVVSNDVDSLETFFSDTSTSLVRIVITFFGVYGILLFLDWRLALILFVPLPLALWAVRFFARKVQPQYRRARQAVGRINSLIENNINGIEVIQAYTAEAEQDRFVGEQSAVYRDSVCAALWERARFIPFIYLIAGTAFALLIGFGGWLASQPYGPSLGEFATFILLAMRLILPIFAVGRLLNQVQRAEASAHRIQEVLQREPRIFDSVGAVALKAPLRRLEFANVSFSYAPQVPVLHDISFTLHQGEMLGVVGPTGAGKSTLVKLLLRMYAPQQGRIYFNETPHDALTLASVRDQVGYVSQDAFVFQGSVAENIRLGSPQATQKEVHEAARIAGALEFIQALPEGFETILGERGVTLSGGQRQRLSLARAVLRDPPLLLLDEATSAVDTQTEELIQANLLALQKDRLVVAVAHRLSTVRQASQIVVIMDGQVAEVGRHEELVEQNGVYAGLWRVQSGGACP
ncbi:MAG: ABC transporter ATP-binding protein [Thermodesulfobacteriota bacterium]